MLGGGGLCSQQVKYHFLHLEQSLNMKNEVDQEVWQLCVVIEIPKTDVKTEGNQQPDPSGARRITLQLLLLSGSQNKDKEAAGGGGAHTPKQPNPGNKGG